MTRNKAGNSGAYPDFVSVHYNFDLSIAKKSKIYTLRRLYWKHRCVNRNNFKAVLLFRIKSLFWYTTYLDQFLFHEIKHKKGGKIIEFSDDFSTSLKTSILHVNESCLYFWIDKLINFQYWYKSKLELFILFSLMGLEVGKGRNCLQPPFWKTRQNMQRYHFQK